MSSQNVVEKEQGIKWQLLRDLIKWNQISPNGMIYKTYSSDSDDEDSDEEDSDEEISFYELSRCRVWIPRRKKKKTGKKKAKQKGKQKGKKKGYTLSAVTELCRYVYPANYECSLNLSWSFLLKVNHKN